MNQPPKFKVGDRVINTAEGVEGVVYEYAEFYKKYPNLKTTNATLSDCYVCNIGRFVWVSEDSLVAAPK